MDSDDEENNKKSNNTSSSKTNYVISFNASNLEQIPQYLNYMAILFDEFRRSPFENEIVSQVNHIDEMKINKDNKERYCVQSILKYYGEAIKKDKIDFPYWKLSQILDSLNETY